MTRPMSGLRSDSKLEGWERIHLEFPIATPELLAQRALQSRTDTKFLLSPSRLPDVLAGLGQCYAAVCPPALYRSLYFDTRELAFFHAHRRGRRVRHKVRVRHVPDRRLSFLEIKTRRSDRLTSKLRVEHAFGDDTLSREDQVLAQSQCQLLESLEPRAWTEYERLTLLGLATDERVTIDTRIRFESDGVVKSLGDLVLVEIKQWPFSRCTPFMEALRAASIAPSSPSKYCLAIASTHSQLPHNRFLPTLRAIEELRHA